MSSSPPSDGSSDSPPTSPPSPTTTPDLGIDVPAASGGRSGDAPPPSASASALELRSLRSDVQGLAVDLSGLSRSSLPGRSRSLAWAGWVLFVAVAFMVVNQYRVAEELRETQREQARSSRAICEARNSQQVALRSLVTDLARWDQLNGDPQRQAIYERARGSIAPIDCTARWPDPAD